MNQEHDNMPPLLELRNVSKRFVKPLDIAVQGFQQPVFAASQPGEWCALLHRFDQVLAHAPVSATKMMHTDNSVRPPKLKISTPSGAPIAIAP